VETSAYTAKFTLITYHMYSYVLNIANPVCLDVPALRGYQLFALSTRISTFIRFNPKRNFEGFLELTLRNPVFQALQRPKLRICAQLRKAYLSARVAKQKEMKGPA
jgi:uncharacterized protein YpmS